MYLCFDWLFFFVFCFFFFHSFSLSSRPHQVKVYELELTEEGTVQWNTAVFPPYFYGLWSIISMFPLLCVCVTEWPAIFIVHSLHLILKWLSLSVRLLPMWLPLLLLLLLPYFNLITLLLLLFYCFVVVGFLMVLFTSAITYTYTYTK